MTQMRMRQSMSQIELAFEQEMALERRRREQLRKRSANRSRARRISRNESRGRIRFSVLLVCLTITVVTDEMGRYTFPADRLEPGTYAVQIHDLSETHNFHLTGPGIDERTPTGEIIHPIWTLTFRNGTYTFVCDSHRSTMHGSITVGPAPTQHCSVPRVVGKKLGTALQAIRRSKCTPGRVRYARSSRPRGRVVRQAPRAGTTLRRGGRVSVVVSRGRR